MMKANGQIDGLLVEVLKKPEDEREEYLDLVCRDDDGLRRELAGLLAVSEEAGDFLERPAVQVSETALSPLCEGPGTTIGRYKLLQQIGEGGFGVVYMAEQLEPVRRKVALKIIKLGMDTKQVIARFEAERQALAIMEHSNIARVLDAGATETGRPYFVMELVKGIPLTDYCDQANLTTKERLDLFMPVCHAVQHAHQKGIIHRDIKPTNVMVTLHDGKPIPKVIDFGIAKATDHRLTEKTLFTEFHQLVGTPAYMSPEQAEMSGLDVDTRTDIYSLGVLLYELLTGTTPFDLTALREAGYGEIQRIIREVDPPIPSTRLSTMDAADLALVAQRRKADTNALSKLLRGDLDWIVMKALEKDRTRRYETARELAMDVERHLANEPILASPPGVIYKFRKFVKRNRVAASAGLAVAVALVLGLMLSTVGFVQASRQRDRAEVAHAAEAKQRKVAVAARDEAQHERDRAIDARQEARRQSYIANVMAAGAALTMNEHRNVRRRLDAAPEEFRDWEWRYLNAETDHSLAVLRGHEAGVLAVAFSPDGTRLASASSDKTVRVWDASTLKELTVLRGREHHVGSIAFSPDGTRLAVAAGPIRSKTDNTVHIWDASTGKELTVMAGHEGTVTSVAFSPDGTRLASASFDNTVRLWDVSTGEELTVLRGHDSSIWTVTFSPDGTRLASASGSSVRIWDASSGAELAVLRGHEAGFWCVVFSPDGTRVASTSYDKTVRLWDASTGTEMVVLRGHRGFVMAAVFSLDGTRLASAGQDSTVRIWDTFTGEQLAVLRGLDDVVWSLALSPDGARLASASSDKTVRVWHSGMGNELSVLRGHKTNVWSVAFSPDGTRLASASGPLIEPEAYNDKQSANTIRIWDLSTTEELAVLRGHEGSISSVAFSPDGARLATGSADRTVRLWNASTGKELTVLRGHEDAVYEVVFSPDGTRLASASGTWRGKTDNTVRIWNPSTATELAVLRGHENLVSSVAFSPNGTRLASASLDKTVRLWNPTTGEELAVLLGHQRPVTSVAFSSDGRSVASGSLDGTVRLWDASTGKELRILRAHELGIWSVAFTPDGMRLATGSADTTVRLWDTSSGEELGVLRGHQQVVRSLAFGPDGTRLASGSQDSTVRLWDTVSRADRYQERQAILASQPDARRIVDKLWQELNDWEAAAQHLRDDTSLSGPIRRAALNTVLRRATDHP